MNRQEGDVGKEAVTAGEPHALQYDGGWRRPGTGLEQLHMHTPLHRVHELL